MKFEDSWDNNTHQDVEDAIKDKVEEIEGRIDDVENSVPDAETIEGIRQAAQDAQDAAAALGNIINENSGRVSHDKAPAVVLRYIHQNGTDDMSLDDLNAGDVYADVGGSLELVIIENGSKTVKNIGIIDKGLIFYSIREQGFYRYLGSAAWELLSQGGEEEQEGTFAELDVDSRLKHIQSPVMVLDCISQSEEPGIADCPIGGYYCYMGNQASACRIRYRKPLETAGSYRDIDLSSPQGHVLYYNKPEDKTYRWDGQKFVAVLWHAGLANDNRLMSSRATAVVLWYISANLDDGETPMGANSGDVYCDSNNHIIVKGGTVNPNKEYMIAANLPTTTDADLGLPDQKLVYYDVNKKDFYRWNGVEWKKALDIDIDTTNLVTITQLNNTLSSYATKSYVDQAVQQAEQGETVVINSDGANIVDEHNNNSVLLAPSARQMKLMYDNFMAVYNSLANIAFTNGKPSLDWIGTKTKYTLFYGTMTGCTADVAAGQVNEGGLRIKLTPTQSSYAFTSVTVNGESVSTTATGDADGSVYIDIIVNQNITVAATAISGRAINFNGTGCSIGTAGVAIGQDLDTTITANEHFTLPESITVKIGNTNITHSYTRAQGNKTATLHIDAANITGDLAITCAADEDNHAVLTIGQLSNVTIKSGTRDLESGSHIYDGETISIKPASGYKLTGKPIFTNGSTTPVTLTPTTESGDIYNGYNFGFNPISNSTIAITNVGATGLNPNLRASLTGTGSESVDSTTDLSSNITEGSAWSTVLSVKSTAEEGTAITSVIPAMEGGGTISYDTNTKRVHTDCVTGNITITVTVTGVVKRTVSLVNSNTDDGNAALKMFSDSAKTSEISNPQINDGGSFTCYLGTSSADVDIAWGLTDGEAWPYPVKVVMGSQDITQAAFDKDAMKVEIPQVTDNVVITAQTMTWASSKSVNTDGSLGVDTTHSATDYIDLSGVSKLVLHHQTYTGANKNAAFYNSEKTRVNYYSMNANYRTCQTQEGWSYMRMTCATSRRKSFFVRAEKNGKWVYLYRGIDYDGRNEDEYNVEYGAGLTKSGGNASITLPAAHVLTDFIAVGDYDMLYFNIGQNTDAYNANTYDSNKTRISGFIQSSSVPREVDNASKSIKYIRMTTDIFDGAYVYGKKTVEGVDVYEWIMRGIAVSDSTLPSGNGTTE